MHRVAGMLQQIRRLLVREGVGHRDQREPLMGFAKGETSKQQLRLIACAVKSGLLIADYGFFEVCQCRTQPNALPLADKNHKLTNPVMARSAATWPSIWKIFLDCRSRQASFAMTSGGGFMLLTSERLGVR